MYAYRKKLKEWSGMLTCMFSESVPRQVYGCHGYHPFPLCGKERGYKLNLARLIKHQTFKVKNSQEFEKDTGLKSRLKMTFSPFKSGKTATLLLLVIYLSFQDPIVSGTYVYTCTV